MRGEGLAFLSDFAMCENDLGVCLGRWGKGQPREGVDQQPVRQWVSSRAPHQVDHISHPKRLGNWRLPRRNPHVDGVNSLKNKYI